MEVAQFTYFQQVGGISCKPISVELTYGLERLAMYLQQVDSVYDIKWNDNLNYGDIYLQSEYEMCVYNFEKADIDNFILKFNIAFTECQLLADSKLILPAYERVLEISHYFNILDARGAISVTDRVNFIKKIRQMACRCAQICIEKYS